METDRTVAQTIYRLVKDEFARGAEKISKSAVIEWTVEYIQDGKKKRANGDTKARKLRLLVESNYLGAQQINGQTYIIPAEGKPTTVKDDEPDTEEEEVSKVKYRYEPIFLEGKPTGRVRQIQV